MRNVFAELHTQRDKPDGVSRDQGRSEEARIEGPRAAGVLHRGAGELRRVIDENSGARSQFGSCKNNFRIFRNLRGIDLSTEIASYKPTCRY
jgi:hypothetical protein